MLSPRAPSRGTRRRRSCRRARPQSGRRAGPRGRVHRGGARWRRAASPGQGSTERRAGSIGRLARVSSRRAPAQRSGGNGCTGVAPAGRRPRCGRPAQAATRGVGPRALWRGAVNLNVGMSARAPVPRRRWVRHRLSLMAATVGVPLPRSGDWRPADGWLPAVLPARNGGLPFAVWLTWSHFSRQPAPHPWQSSVAVLRGRCGLGPGGPGRGERVRMAARHGRRADPDDRGQRFRR